MARAYLDYHADSPIYPKVRAAMQMVLAAYGNPASIHKEGQKGLMQLEEARASIAAYFDAPAQSLVFSSGGTEACNLALHAGLANGCERLLIADIEHPAVLDTARALARDKDIDMETIAVNAQGQLRLDVLAELLHDKRPALIAVMAVNNETGVVQPSADIAKLAHAHGSLLFTDAVQAVGKLPLRLGRDGDMLAITAHKFGGPQGIGAFLGQEKLKIPARQLGGGQERYRRAGTPNLPGAVGFAVALALAEQARPSLMARFARWQATMEKWLKKQCPDVQIMGDKATRVPCCSCISAPQISAETMVIALDLAGYAVSAGSACSSGKITPSHVLQAQGLSPDLVGGAIRLSWGWASRKSDLMGVARAWVQARKHSKLAA